MVVQAILNQQITANLRRCDRNSIALAHYSHSVLQRTNGVRMDANLQQFRRICRCYRFVNRHRPSVRLENVARQWIERYAGHWRDRHGAGH